MNKYIHFSILMLGFGFLFSLQSCDKDFLANPPEDLVPADEFMDTPEKAKEALNSAYEALSSGGFAGGQLQLLSELMTENLNGELIENGDWLAHYTRTTDIFLGTTRSLMHEGGKVHGRANFVADNLDQVDGLSEEDRRVITGEIQFIRALSHFELVRMFAQPYGFTADNSHPGIPIHTAFGKEKITRSSVKEVYDQVIADFTAAIDLLPDDNDGYADTWAAKGYLAKVYFQMNDFANAYEMADDVIQNGGFGWDTEFDQRFAPNSSAEAVFELISTDNNDNSGGALAGYYRVNPDNTAAVYLSQDLFEYVRSNPNDLRGTAWMAEGFGGTVLCNKFVQDPRSWMNVPLVHITELKLIRAESAAELGTNLDVAINDLNDIRSRADLSNLPSSLPAEEIINFARRERRIELFAEGNRLHELKRQAIIKEGSKLQIRDADWDCPGMVCQFPDNELQGNPEIVPNPQGGCN